MSFRSLGLIVKVLLRHRINPKAVTPLEDDELFGRESGQRLSQGTHAHPVARTERCQEQPLAGFELAGNDVVANTLGRNLREGLAARFHGRIGPGGTPRHELSLQRETESLY